MRRPAARRRPSFARSRPSASAVAVDDSGTGYSSLAYLKDFPVDSLKIDGSFIQGLGDGGDDSAIVRSVVALGHALRLSVTAEGIETVDQLAELRGLQWDHGQGYLFARPGAWGGVVRMFIDTHQPQTTPGGLTAIAGPGGPEKLAGHKIKRTGGPLGARGGSAGRDTGREGVAGR